MKQVLVEYIDPKTTNAMVESVDDTTGKSLYLRGIFCQGGIRNANQRIYSVNEISRAVKTLNDQIQNDYTVWGELEHPSDLKINADRISHLITEMWMDGNNAYGKMKIVPTPSGMIIQTLVNYGKLGVSSRGSGDVDANGNVTGFEIVTVDVVVQPSAPGAYPTPIYEHLLNTKGGYNTIKLAEELQGNRMAQKYLEKSLVNFIAGLK